MHFTNKKQLCALLKLSILIKKIVKKSDPALAGSQPPFKNWENMK